MKTVWLMAIGFEEMIEGLVQLVDVVGDDVGQISMLGLVPYVVTVHTPGAVIRCLDEEGASKYDYYFSNARRDTPTEEFARVALAAHRIEEAIKRGKSESGLSHYEVRNWRGWHHHQVLSLIATWFLVCELRRGKKWTPAITVPQLRDGIAMLLRAAYNCDTPAKIARNKTRRLQRNEEARFYHYKSVNRLPPLRIHQRR